MKQRFLMSKEWISQMGAYLREVTAQPFDFSVKTGHQDIVTAHDKRVEQFFRQKIHEHFPQDDIVGEEFSGRMGSGNGIRWYIDPVDGTTNFVNLRRNFAISVGCYLEGQPQFGLVLDVIHNDLYSAFVGEGAFKNHSRLGKDAPPENLGEMILSTPNVQDAFWRGYPQQRAMLRLADEVRAVRSTGSVALELCQVAEGIVDIFVAMRSAPWDHNAARLILEESGCCISQLGAEALCLDAETSIYACRSCALAQKLKTEYGF